MFGLREIKNRLDRLEVIISDIMSLMVIVEDRTRSPVAERMSDKALDQVSRAFSVAIAETRNAARMAATMKIAESDGVAARMVVAGTSPGERQDRGAEAFTPSAQDMPDFEGMMNVSLGGDPGGELS